MLQRVAIDIGNTFFLISISCSLSLSLSLDRQTQKNKTLYFVLNIKSSLKWFWHLLVNCRDDIAWFNPN